MDLGSSPSQAKFSGFDAEIIRPISCSQPDWHVKESEKGMVGPIPYTYYLHCKNIVFNPGPRTTPLHPGSWITKVLHWPWHKILPQRLLRGMGRHTPAMQQAGCLWIYHSWAQDRHAAAQIRRWIWTFLESVGITQLSMSLSCASYRVVPGGSFSILCSALQLSFGDMTIACQNWGSLRLQSRESSQTIKVPRGSS